LRGQGAKRFEDKNGESPDSEKNRVRGFFYGKFFIREGGREMKRMRMVLGAFLVPAMVFPALAQEQAEEGKRLPEVVVSATRTEKPADEVAGTITVITAEELKEEGEETLEDALRRVPGLDIVRTGGSGGDASIFIRGGRGEHTIVLVDGVEINDPMSTSRAAHPSLIALDGIERIEVIRGPTSPLYGSDALAGVVHIITRRGEGSPGFGLSLEGGSFNSSKESGEVFGRMGKFSWYGAFSNFDTDGISSADRENDNTERDAYHLQSAEARLGIDPAEWISLDLTFRGYNSKTELDAFDYLEGIPEDDPNYSTTNTSYFAGLGTEIFLWDGKWHQRIITAQANHRRDLEDEKDDDHPGDSLDYTYLGDSLQMTWQNDFDLNPQNRFSLGLDYREESGEYEGEGESIYGKYEDEFERETSIIRSSFAQWDFHRRDAGLVVGARSDHHDEYGYYNTYRIGGTCLLEATDSRFRASWGTGFRAPSLFQRYYTFIPGAPRPPGEIVPEKSESWELGLVQSLIDDRLRFSATYFDALYEDMIDWDSVTWTYINIAEATSRGYEFGLDYRPWDQLELALDYSVVDARDRETDDPLIRRAGEKYSAALSYAPTKRARIHISALHVGERDDLAFIMGEEKRIELDPYTLVNAGFRYFLKDRLSLSLRGENLLDEHYQEAHGYGTIPMTFYAGVNYTFQAEAGQ
jgi:vitamin B12 transporter